MKAKYCLMTLLLALLPLGFVFAADAPVSEAQDLSASAAVAAGSDQEPASLSIEGRAEVTQSSAEAEWQFEPQWLQSADSAVGPASCAPCFSRWHCRRACGGFCGRDVGLHCGSNPDEVFCFCGF